MRGRTVREQGWSRHTGDRRPCPLSMERRGLSVHWAAVFDALSDRLQAALDDVRGRGKLDEDAVSRAMREIRLALLEADVNFKVVKDFVAQVRARALGADVTKSLTPGQEVVRIVHEELTSLMGSGSSQLAFASKPPTVILLAGLQGSGKTTAAAKLALLLRKEGHSPALVAADLARPAAVEQLEQLGRELQIPVYTADDPVSAVTKGIQQRPRPGQGRRHPRHRRPAPHRRGADGGAVRGPRRRRSRRMSCSCSTR